MFRLFAAVLAVLVLSVSVGWAAQAVPAGVVTQTAASPYCDLRGVPVEEVTLSDAFWLPRMKTNHMATIPHEYAECERTGRIDNFRRAAGLPTLHRSVKRSGEWGIKARDVEHPIFEGLDNPVMFYSAGLPTREVTCHWNAPAAVSGAWLAEWEVGGGHYVCGENALGEGKALFIGTGAYDWDSSAEDNKHFGNLTRFTHNVLDYLGAGSVLFLGISDAPGDLPRDQARACAWAEGAVDAHYASVAALQADPALLDGVDVVWWYEKESPDLPEAMTDPTVVARIQAFLEQGGGIFLNGFSSAYLHTLGLEAKAPDAVRHTLANGFQGIYFNDSDVYKWMEAAAFSLATFPDEALAQQLDELIALVGQAQQDDGYLNTYYMFENAKDRWTNLGSMHELYLGGHMLQAAVAHHRVTGKRDFLDIGVRWADHCCRRFGPDKAPGTAGHAEVEMALVELYRETGEKRYLELASFFTEQRGHGVIGGSKYLQDQAPIREQRSMEGHAVRQLYLCSGVADLYAETGDKALLDALLAQWADFTDSKEYLTGGAGARREGEAFGDPYELPNATAYAETCAAIASFMFNYRMLQITGEARYADVMETAMYNGILSGVSLDGTTFFYVNPLETEGTLTEGTHYACKRTTAHFDSCACCPPNVARWLAELPGSFYSEGKDGVYVNFYAAGSARVEAAGTYVLLSQVTEYPWDGAVSLRLQPDNPARFTLHLRYPRWARNVSVRINGKAAVVEAEPGSFIGLDRTWEQGDTVRIEFPMPVRRMKADPRVADDRGRAALQRGPVVYCLEQVDLEAPVYGIALPPDVQFAPEARPDLLGGVTVLRGEGVRAEWSGGLYADAEAQVAERVPVTAVPYYAWANREPGAMRVWLPEGR